LSLVGDWDSFTENSTTQTRNHSDVHEVESITTGGNTDTLVHDAKGNLTTNVNGDSYIWDFDNRMVSADTNGDSIADVEFEYDALGRRVKYIGDANPHIYVYAGQQLVVRYNSGDSPTASKWRFVFASYIDEPILFERKTGSAWDRYYFHRNRQYSISALTDSTGTVVERYAYDPYGNVTIYDALALNASNTSAFDNPFMYTGRFYVDKLDMYYFRARWFDSNLGRFTNRDPLRFVDGMSLYRGYFSPNSMDPFGKIEYEIHFGSLGWNREYDVDVDETTGKPTSTTVEGKYIAVRTSAGTMVGVWAPNDRTEKSRYWCHGYTFGGSVSPTGPYSLFGQYVRTVLEDEGWNRICCANAIPYSDIAVFTAKGGGQFAGMGMFPSHSGIIASVGLNHLFAFDEEKSLLSSKPGDLSHEVASFSKMVHGYNYGKYSCYTTRRGPDTECCGKAGTHEIAPPNDFDIGPRYRLNVEKLELNEPVKDEIDE
jgi:RHS repeat-associated protein